VNKGARRLLSVGIVAAATVLTAIMAVRYFYPEHSGEFIAGLLGTVVGIIFGLPVGLYLDRVMKAEDVEREKQQRERDRCERLRTVLERLKDELVHNGTALLDLEQALPNLPSAGPDVWRRRREIVDSLEFDVYREFRSIHRTSSEKKQEHSLGLFYRNIRRVRDLVHQADAARPVLLGSTVDEVTADTAQREKVAIAINVSKAHLQNALKDIARITHE
jgi:hypothetical protein